MAKIVDTTRESWIKSTFPEWGTWLVEDIENEVVPDGCGGLVAQEFGLRLREEPTLPLTFGAETESVLTETIR